MLYDATENVFQICLWIDAERATGLYKKKQSRSCFSACYALKKEPVLASNSKGAVLSAGLSSSRADVY